MVMLVGSRGEYGGGGMVVFYLFCERIRTLSFIPHAKRVWSVNLF